MSRSQGRLVRACRGCKEDVLLRSLAYLAPRAACTSWLWAQRGFRHHGWTRVKQFRAQVAECRPLALVLSFRPAPRRKMRKRASTAMPSCCQSAFDVCHASLGCKQAVHVRVTTGPRPLILHILQITGSFFLFLFSTSRPIAWPWCNRYHVTHNISMQELRLSELLS